MNTQTKYGGYEVINNLTVYEKYGVAISMTAEVTFGDTNLSATYRADIKDNEVNVYVNDIRTSHILVDSLYYPPAYHTPDKNADVLYVGIANEINTFIEKNFIGKDNDICTVPFVFQHYQSSSEQELWKEAITRAKESFRDAYDADTWEDLDKYQREDCVHYEYKRLRDEKGIGRFSMDTVEKQNKKNKQDFDDR